MKKPFTTILSITVILLIGCLVLSLTTKNKDISLICGYGAKYKVESKPDTTFYIEWQSNNGVSDKEVLLIDVKVTDVLYKTGDINIAMDSLKNEFSKRNIVCTRISCEILQE